MLYYTLLYYTILRYAIRYTAILCYTILYTVILYYTFQNAQIESVTLMGNTGNDSSMFSIPGLDYVSHEDVIPYTTSDPQPIHNDLFEKFFIHDKSSGNVSIQYIVV